jgi:hypothetical protein
MIELIEFKYWLGVKPTITSPEQNSLDEFLQGIINEAVSSAEDICNQKLAYCLDTFEKDLSDNANVQSMYLNFPIDKVTKIQYLNSENVLTDIIAANPEGITSDIHVNKKSGKLLLSNNYTFEKGINVIEYYHGYTVATVPGNLKKCIKYLATIDFNNSSVRDSRFGLTSKNMNAAGSSGLSFQSYKDLMEYVTKELQPYKILNI